jgi:hypothetical protein
MAWRNPAELTAKAKYYFVTDSVRVPRGKGEKQSGEDGEIDLKPYVYKESARCTILYSNQGEMTMDGTCLCPRMCDCENPEPTEGVALASEHCHEHNLRQKPYPDCSAAIHWWEYDPQMDLPIPPP